MQLFAPVPPVIGRPRVAGLSASSQMLLLRNNALALMACKSLEFSSMWHRLPPATTRNFLVKRPSPIARFRVHAEVRPDVLVEDRQPRVEACQLLRDLADQSQVHLRVSPNLSWLVVIESRKCHQGASCEPLWHPPRPQASSARNSGATIFALESK